jgi:hypothetical protein
LAFEFSKRGFVILCTVSNPSDVDALEKKGRGWIKALVLEGGEINSVQPFLRSLGSAVGLRFPVGSPGSTFVANPNREGVCITAVIDGLMIGGGNGNFGEGVYYPLESLGPESIQKGLTDPLTFEILLFRSLLPVLRRSTHNPSLSNVPRTWLTLLPSNTSNTSLPFVSLQSARDKAMMSLIDSLRREMDVVDWKTPVGSDSEGGLNSKGEKVEIKIVMVGNVKPHKCSPGNSPVRGGKSPSASVMGLGGNQQSILNLSANLEMLYGPTLHRRLAGIGSRRVYKEGRGRKASSFRFVADDVWNVVVKGQGGRIVSTGEGGE